MLDTGRPLVSGCAGERRRAEQEPDDESQDGDADDDRFLRHALGQMLTDAGYTVVTARDGMEAVGMLDLCDADFVICDVRMPQMDGFQTVEAIRAAGQPRWFQLTGLVHDIAMKRLLDVLRELDEALAIQESTGQKLGQALVSLGHISESQLLTALCADAGIPFIAFKYAENTGQMAPIREQAGTFADSIKLWSAA